MSDGAARVDHTDLGVDSLDRGAEVALYEDGDVTIQIDQDGAVVLEPEQVRALFVFLLNQPVLEDALKEVDA